MLFEGDDEIVPIFWEQPIPPPPPTIEIHTIQEHLDYITDTSMRSQASALLEEIESWQPGIISKDAISYGVSIKVKNRVFAYLVPRRKAYLIQTFDTSDKWTDYPIQNDEELTNVKNLLKTAMERKMK